MLSVQGMIDKLFILTDFDTGTLIYSFHYFSTVLLLFTAIYSLRTT